MMKKYTFLVLIFVITYTSHSQSKYWVLNTQKGNFSKNNLKQRSRLPLESKIYSLDYSRFKSDVLKTSLKGVKIIELPTTKGLQKFAIKEASSLSLELSAKFPMIQSYVGQGIDDASLVARFSLGTDGLHVVVFSAGGSSFYIDPYTKDNHNYIAYARNSLAKNQSDFTCKVKKKINLKKTKNTSFRNPDDGKLRTFRLALACSGEYALFHLINQGVVASATDVAKKAAVLSAMNTTMTRVNGIYERDLGIKMELVANNDTIIFLDNSTDEITDGDPDKMIDEVQNICDSQIGSENYDIGHVFSTGGDGLASFGVVCVNGEKARGVTGRSEPIGDPYDIDYVAHEMGHQFGASHTQNNDNCNRNDFTAVEPGSASTIMGYAGICSPNVQNDSDGYFHSVNIDEIWATIQNSATCGVETSNGNVAPIANAGLDYTIPKSTPFVLRGEGSDVNTTNILSYNWEQVDNQIATMPPLATNTGGPVFRSLPSSNASNRYMPALSTVVGGSTSSVWEVVPSVARDLNFSLVVRDNNPGGGNSARDDMKVTVTDDEPFTVTLPNSVVSWRKGNTETITWNKGTTDVAPINCQNVDIKLSINGGLTFPITLVSNTPNDGTEDIVIPNFPTNNARIMVAAADNIFYNINSTNFIIDGDFDSQSISVQTTSETCQNLNDGIITINVQQASYTYIATLTGVNTNLSEQIVGANHSFSNLQPGSYQVCIALKELDLTYCYEVLIVPSSPISLKVSSDVGRYSFYVNAGTSPYSVFLNNDLLDVFDMPTFELDIKGTGNIVVKTAKECEGEYRTATDSAYLKKNPVTSTIDLVLPFYLEKTYIDTTIFDMHGKTVFRSLLKKEGNNLSIPFHKVSKGIYILKLAIDNSSPIKIIKE